MIPGCIYGVVLNDRSERAALAAAFAEKPYAAAPVAPVVYMKPRTALAASGAAVRLPPGAEAIAAPTLAVLFARDVSRATPAEAEAALGAICLALDVSLPEANYYRPAVAQRNGDGFLPLGAFSAPVCPSLINTVIDGAPAHEWRLDRLHWPPAQLIAELSAFMTLRAGDLLLIGLPGDAPRVRAGQKVSVTAEGLASLSVGLAEAQP